MSIPNPVRPVRSGKRGRPRKVVDSVLLQNAFSPGRNIPVSKLAKKLNIDRRTLSAQMKKLNINREFTEITDEDLDGIIREYKQLRPTPGLSYIIGYLRSHDLYIQRWRVAASHQRVSPLAADVNGADAIQRRTYWVKRPNSLWHCDGHHKLIKYGFVIHAFIDGHDRVVSKIPFKNLSS